MILRRFLTIAALATFAALGTGGAGFAAPRPVPADEALLKAYEAFRAGDPARLAKYSAAADNPVLAPYLAYWRLRVRLEDTPDADVREFLQREAGSYLAERLRADWLRELGKRGEWQSFDRELPLLVRDDLELRCYGWLSRLARGDDGAYAQAKEVWLEPRELPEGCNTLVDRMREAGAVSTDDLWRRVRVLWEYGQISAARRALASFTATNSRDARMLLQAARAPRRLLAHPPASLAHRATREIVVLALLRLGRSDAEAAVEALRGRLGERLPGEDVSYLWGRLAYEGARQLLPEANYWYRLADDALLDDDQLAWKARAALRAADWQMVRNAIDRLSAGARLDPAWTYWYGRALGALGQEGGAHAYFLRIADQPNFYGLLASEELGAMASVPEPFHVPSDAEVAAAATVPGIMRALELYRLELRTEATREWVFTIRDMNDAQLLAAAEVARRAGIFDRAINTADRTRSAHNFKVRFLTPFREVFDEYTNMFGLEEAWVLGLVRQESRFIANARSSAGAKGLMQLMPRTARWVAKRNGLKYSPARVADVPLNVALGTGYLKHVLDDLGHELLASAAYNAGPGRARRWRDAQPLEGAVYAETIPFPETRDYVKKVMANTMFYAQLIGGKLVPLKERLGLIPAKSSADRFNQDLP